MEPKKRDSHAFVAVVVFLLFSVLTSAVLASEETVIDWERARNLLRREQRGETLTEEEKAYLERAKRVRRERGRLARPQGKAVRGAETTGLIPVTEMAEIQYKGQTGGLYGGGRNTPPESHRVAARKVLAKIRPLDAEGQPAKTGKIVLISLGMSNTTQEFSTFKKLADADPNKSPSVVIVDCAQGGQAAHQWAYPDEGGTRKRPSPWIVMDQRIKQADVTAAQVQAVWIKQAQMGPARLGEFPAHARSLTDDTVVILNKLKVKFPNLQIGYLSSRIYAGYATGSLNPEPYAYESAFSVRWLIEEQIEGIADLNYDSSKGEVKSPLLLWGPYLWADGVKGRKTDDLVWKREDLAGDGTHPSTSGREKVARMLLEFFKSDPNAKSWFLK
ncbi:MAG: hypothetical protein JSW66_08500 [Phycisphaerales bacterium]|nr:MAG: hypothetical protein JSW66_08500 [Phycisphaerales bacterium]